MKHGKKILHGTLLISVLGFSFGAPGCNSSSRGKVSNPFAADRQTVAPPATFSSQSSFLGQTPGSYTPQAPATVYPQGTGVPGTIPAGVPLPADVTVPASTVPSSTVPAATPVVPSTPSPYGSLNYNGASTFQSGSVPTAQLATTAPTVAGDWKAATSPADVALPDAGATVASTPQTASQYMESKVGTVSTVSTDGRSQSVTAAPETLIVSSSQAITKISGEQAMLDEPPPAEPQTLYKGW